MQLTTAPLKFKSRKGDSNPALSQPYESCRRTSVFPGLRFLVNTIHSFYASNSPSRAYRRAPPSELAGTLMGRVGVEPTTPRLKVENSS